MANLVHFNVSQVRVAATCPRILYFDLLAARKRRAARPRTTRIWKEGKSDVTACGTLFHNAVEAFNEKAASSPEILALLQACAAGEEHLHERLLHYVYTGYVKRADLAKAGGPQQQAFIQALTIYTRELSDIVSYALTHGTAPEEIVDQMFGDRRRRVDVTFNVGPNGEGVHVTGQLDYVFYDWRVAKRRIIDYKLTPGDDPKNDLFQVGVYGLMHHIQHHTEPDVAVFYLHPRRQMLELQWAGLFAQRHKIYDLLASMAAWASYAENIQTGLKPPGEPIYCGRCPWKAICTRRLGPKSEGGRVTLWEEKLKAEPAAPAEPRIEVEPTDDMSAAAAPRSSAGSSPTKTADVPSDSLWLGRLEAAADRRVFMPAAVLATHAAVVGAAGSGKTWLAKGIVEEAVLQGIPVLAVDPQGDLVQFIRQADTANLAARERARFDSYWQSVEPRIFTPGSSHATRLSLNPLRLPRLDQLAEISDPLRRQEEYEGMLATAAANLASLAQVKGEHGAQTAFLVKLLRAMGRDGAVDELSMVDIIAAIRAPDDLGIDDPDAYIRKTDRDKLARSLNALIDGPAGQLFRDGLPLDVDRLRSPAAAGKTPLNVIYLNAMSDDSQKQFFVASLAAEIYRWMVSRAEGGGMKLLFYIDEARDYLPAGNRLTPAKQPVIRLFNQGRKFGVGCLICTQSPRLVDYTVFGNSSTKIIGRLESAQEVERVGDWFSTGGGAPGWLNDRKGAGRGSFVGRWPEMDASFEGAAFTSRVLYSLHEGAWSPDRVEREWGDYGASDRPFGVR
jgi:uncharacterized protein